MKNFRDYDRSQRFLLPPDLSDWVADDDLAHFIIEAVERVELSSFHLSRTGSGKAQYHPHMMLALLIYCYARGIFSSRAIERATYRDVSVRFIAVNDHPDHDTIAKFRRRNQVAISRAFEQVLLLASKAGLLKFGTVSVDGTQMKANASKIKSVRYDRIQTLREKLSQDIADLMAQAERADNRVEDDGLSLPEEISRRKNLKEKLDEAAARLEGEALDAAQAASTDHDEGDGDSSSSCSSSPVPPPDKQTNLTDPDSAIMRKSVRHEYTQSYNAQAVVDADGSQLALATDVYSTSNDRDRFDELIGHLCDTVGKPETVLADSGYAGKDVVEGLETRGIEALIAVHRNEQERPYRLQAPAGQTENGLQRILEPWRLAMIEKLQAQEAKHKYRKRKQTVEPVFGIIKSVLGFQSFRLRGMEKVKSEWQLITLAYNCKRIAKLKAA